jgi:hypothetical protein
MIEDFTDYDEVKDGECFTTGIISSGVLDNTDTYFIDSNGREWVIKDMEDEDPILIPRNEAEADWREG